MFKVGDYITHLDSQCYCWIIEGYHNGCYILNCKYIIEDGNYIEYELRYNKKADNIYSNLIEITDLVLDKRMMFKKEMTEIINE